jgi:hypothetical protein
MPSVITHPPQAIRERDRRLTGRNRREHEPVSLRDLVIVFGHKCCRGQRQGARSLPGESQERAVLMHPGHPLLGIRIIEPTPAPFRYQFRAFGFIERAWSHAQHTLSGRAAATFQWSGGQRSFPRQYKKFRNWNRERAGKPIQDINGWVFLLALQASQV